MLRMKMARGKKAKSKLLKRFKEDEEKKAEPVKNEEPKRTDEKSNKISTFFKSEEMHEICGLLNTDELVGLLLFPLICEDISLRKT